jgi:hypothetical protein
MSIQSRVDDLKSEIESLERKRERALGAFATYKDELKDKYGCKNLAEAKELVRTKRKEVSRMEDEIEMQLSKAEEYFDEI